MSRNYLIDHEAKRLTFTDRRFYLHRESGTWQTSVSTVLECYPKTLQFLQWLKENGDDADRIRDEAGDNGDIVHYLTEIYDKGQEVSCLTKDGNVAFSSKAWAMFERYVEFSERYQPEILEIEKEMVSPEMGLGGTLDRKFLFGEKFGEHAGKKFLVDIKTSNQMHKQYWLQAAAYVKLYEKLTGVKVDGIAILWLNAKPVRTVRRELFKARAGSYASLKKKLNITGNYLDVYMLCF